VLGGQLGTTFYDAPRPSPGRTDVKRGSGTEVAIAPVEGLGVVHFPATSPAHGGVTDYNAYHEAEPPESGDKWVAQQFVWSHERLDWERILEPENLPPRSSRTADVI